jgi:hypothetical protein
LNEWKTRLVANEKKLAREKGKHIRRDERGQRLQIEGKVQPQIFAPQICWAKRPFRIKTNEKRTKSAPKSGGKTKNSKDERHKRIEMGRILLN